MKVSPAVLLPALLGTLLASPVLGQTKVAGTKLGIVFADIDTNFYEGVEINTGAKTAFSAGVYFGVDLHRRFRLQLEMQYVRKGMDLWFPGVTGAFNLDYLELLIPATFMIPFEGSRFVPRLYVGPAAALELSCHSVVEAGGRSYKSDCWDTHRVQFGVLLGGGSDLRLSVGV